MSNNALRILGPVAAVVVAGIMLALVVAFVLGLTGAGAPSPLNLYRSVLS